MKKERRDITTDAIDIKKITENQEFYGHKFNKVENKVSSLERHTTHRSTLKRKHIT